MSKVNLSFRLPKNRDKKTNHPKDNHGNSDIINEQLSLFARFGLVIPFPVLTRKEYFRNSEILFK